ncbi:MAG TPA: class II fructose-bisphosphate aldolase [Thermoanaerobaculia bacterium]|nr:class II fructose-bisphosphate aldolase [Thermoanaerobaculia bacterium]
MIHENIETLHRSMAAMGLSPAAQRISSSENQGAIRESLIDDLIFTAVFSADSAAKSEARRLIHTLAREMGAVSSSIQPLYEAIGRGEVTGFTTPAHNIRALTYDVCRALFRAAIKHKVGAFIFEIARSEIGYTEQRPGEYAAAVLAAAIKEGFKGPVFIQGDHFQASAKKWKDESGKRAEVKAIESLIDEAIAAEFFNIDIDTSTLVDLDFETRDEQQKENYEGAAHFTRYIRERQPDGIEISVGGEIGEVGKHNTSPDEFRAYMDGYRRSLPSGMKGISKISIQTGTSHGGVPLPDGTIAKANIDFEVLREISKIGRAEYEIAGSVQHGASTLPEEVFDRFPQSDAVEIHLATGFQNMILDHAAFPFRDEIRKFCFDTAADERKEDETDEQFVYKTRKKSLGPFKQRMWELSEQAKAPIIASLETKFAFLFQKLGVVGTREVVNRHVPIAKGGGPAYREVSGGTVAMATIDPNEGE